jgi:pre-rRNA-processing protein TSR4
VIQEEKVVKPVVPTKSPWGADSKDQDDDDNDWGVEDGDDDNMENMEAMLQDMEVSGPKGMGAKKKAPKKASSSNSPADLNVPRFTCYEIRATQEPGARKVTAQSLDDDDVGIAAAGSDAKIQQMLARYMAEEDDEEILSALRGSAGGGGNGTEKDERLPEEDRVMLAFNDRVKRSPRQVLRYAKNGTPIWSAPLPKQPQQAKKGHNNKQVTTDDPLAVPNCTCGAKRIFECQLMPSLLHVLEVEKHAPDSKAPSATDTMADILNREFVNGGLNWGAMAIYTCVDSCESSREEFVIMQNSIDGMPERRGDGNMVVAVQMDEDDDDEQA